MRAFKAEDFLLVREEAGGHDAVGQAMVLLTNAFSGESVEALGRLPLGRRNDRLLALRERLFGPRLEAYAECPQCGEELELALDANAFPPPADDAPPAQLELEADGYTIRFRLLDSGDLQAAAECADVSDARALLVERCVLEARRGDGDAVAAGELPPEI